MRSAPDATPPETGQRRRAWCAAFAAAAAACPRAARSRGSARWDESQAALELDDAEVQQVRKTESSLRLYDLGRGCFVKLEEALRPGELLHDADAIFLGELHDSAADHLVHRLIIDALSYQLFVGARAQRGEVVASMTSDSPPPSLAVGVEYFSAAQQKAIDEYVFGGGTPAPGQRFVSSGQRLEDLREATAWDARWSYDWQLYSPLFRWCRLTQSRLLGLDVPREASSIVAQAGWQNTPGWLRSLLPELDLSKQRHRRRFEGMLGKPLEDAVSDWSLPLAGFKPRAELDKLYDAQTLRDEYLAKSSFKYLDDRGGRLVVAAGIGHVWRDSAPERFEARAARSGRPLRSASVVPWRADDSLDLLRGCADYAWFPDGPGGAAEATEAMLAQRSRLRGKPRVFPAGFI